MCRENQDIEITIMKDNKPTYHDLEDEIIRLKLELKIRDEMINAIPNPLFIKNKDFKYTNCNDAFAEYLGLPKSKIINSSVYDISQKELADKYYAADCEIREQSGNQEYESKVKYADGTLHDIIFNKARLVDEENVFSGIVGIMLDITEQKQADEKLLKNQKRYQKAQSIGNVGNWEYDLVSTKYWGSKGARKILGFNPEPIELTTERVENCIVERERVHQALIDLIEHDKKYDLVYDILTEDKGIRKTIYSIAELEKDTKGNPLKITGIINDITVQKETEEALIKAKEKAEESELTFRKIFEDSFDAILLIDHTSVFVECNQAALNLLKMTREQFLFQPPANISPEYQPSGQKSEEAAIEMINLAYKKGIHRFDWTHINAEGGEFIVEISLMPIQVKGQTMLHTAWRDITARKRAEDETRLAKEKAEGKTSELKKQQELFETMFNTIKEGVVITNTKREIIHANKGMFTTFGYNQNEIIGKQTKILYADTDKFKEAGNNVFNKEAAKNDKEYLTYYKHKNNRVFPGETFGTKLYDDEGEWIGNIGIMRDVSEREGFIKELKLAKEKAEESEQRLKLATSSAELGIWDWDLINNSMIWDERMFELYGIKQNTFSNTIDAWTNGLYPDDQQRATDEFNSALAGDSDFDTTFRILHPNGTVKYLKADAVVIRNNSKKAIRMIGINRDITESILAEQSLKISETHLKELNVTKDKFFSIISHDLRSPFGSVVSLLSIMAEKNAEFTLDEFKRFSQSALKTAQSTYQLLENLLEWSRLQRGVLPFDPEPITLKEFVNTLDPSIFEMAKKKQIAIDFDIKNDLTAFADSMMLHSIVRNLLTNAMKFTNEGGKVEIKAKYYNENRILISIKDNGIGMDKTRLNKLFHTGVNVSRPGTDAEPSSGLGLILCKEFVEKQGGQIWIESEEGIGSTFYFSLPESIAN
jgi:PAS domain S-box-containing protein